jgi:hypothetical protein
MNNLRRFFYFPLFALLGCHTNSEQPLFVNDAFSIFHDRVVQDTFVAKALSATSMVSNYQSPSNLFQSALVTFKFSINGKDNEMMPGIDHRIVVKPSDGEAVSPVITFGKQYAEPLEEGLYLQPETQWRLRVNMSPVLEAFAGQGFYVTPKGEKIFKEDFKALYVAGNTSPMTWDFDNLKNRPQLELKDPDGDGIYETTLILNARSDLKRIDSIWNLTAALDALPQYKSPHLIADAIYNMSLQEMQKAIEKDSTLRTGAEWAGVWTRDVSYSIILSMAYMQPRVAINSLRKKVNKRKRIIQDTGTGGAWPVSTDRMIWAVAAWEIYLATGDDNWLREAYEVIKLSLEDDYKVCYDAETGLVKGESSFLDWREQTYPKWMEPADIFESLCLGTNAVHFKANTVAALMAKKLNDVKSAAMFEAKADSIKQGINNLLWQHDRGCYGQYLYGQVYKVLSPRAEALGEALTVLFDIAPPARQSTIVSSTPVVNFGIPCIYPQIPGIPPYHNNGIWPFVQTYWLLAGAKVGNEQSVMHSIAAIYRPAALFLTNKENFVADNGDFSGTVINSSNMLWSLSGNISLVHKVLFGIGFTEAGLIFKPFVPSALRGTRQLTGFTYRNAVLDIEVEGYGDKVETFMLDDRPLPVHVIPENLEGRHKVKMKMNNAFSSASKVNVVPNVFSAATPILKGENQSNGQLEWTDQGKDMSYVYWINGKLKQLIKGYPVVSMPPKDSFMMLQMLAQGRSRQPSFLSAPFEHVPDNTTLYVEAEDFTAAAPLPYKGFEGHGFVEISKSRNTKLSFKVNIDKPGRYRVQFRYANGNGPINTENKCAIRSLYHDAQFTGSIIFPQRGTQEWSSWGLSNGLIIRLNAGEADLSLQFREWNENMNDAINHAMIDRLILTYLGN